MVGLPGFEPGSRDPQPRSIGQANLQAPIWFFNNEIVRIQNIAGKLKFFPRNTERSYFIN